MKCHRLKREDGFACLAHWLDCVLVSLGGDDGAKAAIIIYDYADATGNSRSTNTGNNRGRLSAFFADANRVGFGRDTFISDIDVVAAKRP
jgi:hypothetical protein